MNLRPLGYEPNELPGCSTPRQRRHLIGEAWPRSSRLRGEAIGHRAGGVGAGGTVKSLR